jgi:hypothetical protein
VDLIEIVLVIKAFDVDETRILKQNSPKLPGRAMYLVHHLHSGCKIAFKEALEEKGVCEFKGACVLDVNGFIGEFGVEQTVSFHGVEELLDFEEEFQELLLRHEVVVPLVILEQIMEGEVIVLKDQVVGPEELR